jgi:hypothetical protein
VLAGDEMGNPVLRNRAARVCHVADMHKVCWGSELFGGATDTIDALTRRQMYRTQARWE